MYRDEKYCVILNAFLFQSNEVAGSTHMELEGLKRGLEYLTKTVNIDVKDLITDRHVMIKKYMKEKQKISTIALMYGI